MSLNYGEIIQRAWQITWKHKILWLFGILAGLGNSSPNFNFNNGPRTGSGANPLPPEITRFFEQFDQNTLIALALGLTCVFLLLAVVLIALQVIGRGGLIGGLRQAAASGQITFGEAWQIGLGKFWTLFIIGLLVGGAVFIAFLVTVVPGILLSVVTFGLGLLCLLPLICVLVIVATLLGVVAYFAQIAAVVEGLGVQEALGRAWQVIRANLINILIMGLLVAVVSFVVNLVLFLPVLIVVVPLGVALAMGQNLGTGALAFGLVCGIAYLPVLLVLSGILQTWMTAVWTFTYEQLARPTAPGAQPAPPFAA